MKFSSPTTRAFALLACWLMTSLPSALQGAGVTIITHGFNGNADGWVEGMARRLPTHYGFAGTNVICYEMTVSDDSGFVVTSRKIFGGHPTNDPTAEIVVKLDWGDLAGFFSQYDTYEVAGAVVPRLLQTNFIAELNGHALAELPLHLIGHSRGGSLVCQMSRLLGTNGVWVDQVTTLDPHPVNEDGNTDPLIVSDAPLRIYENVLFADNIYQDFGGYPHGQSMPSSYNRRLTALPGGYSSAHSDAHLWYHSTLDFRQPANDTEATLSVADRATWFTAYETSGVSAGFLYSRIGGGNRLSTDRPAGANADQLLLGYNRRWDLGAGLSGNRTALPFNAGVWPNIIDFNVAGSTVIAFGQSNSVELAYQWARPDTTNTTLALYLDRDLNPWNGNERLFRQVSVPGTTALNVSFGAVDFTLTASNSTPGVYTVLARMTAGSRSRFAYAPETLTVLSGFDPPTLAITRPTNSQARVEVHGIPGQRIVLEDSTTLTTWRPIATNWLETSLWSVPVSSGAGRRFYRGSIPDAGSQP